jgi:hypothetical protein
MIKTPITNGNGNTNKWVSKLFEIFLELMNTIAYYAPLQQNIKEDIFNKTVSLYLTYLC